MFKGKKVFISGGAGVIGKELVELLLKEEAIIFVGDLKPIPKGFGDVIYREGDLNTLSKEEIEDFAPEYFFHLAATFERSTETYGFFNENFHHNVKLSNHLICLMENLPSLKKVIFASSYLIYNPISYLCYDLNPNFLPSSLREIDETSPRNLCGMAKRFHEKELQFLNEQNKDKQFISARIFRSYGKGSRDIISRWIDTLIIEEPITVYQEENMFDYIYAGDVALGLLKLAETKDFKGIVNLGSGLATKVSDILEVLKFHFPNMKRNDKEIDAPYEKSQADISRLESLTCWHPETKIEGAISLMIKDKTSEIKNVLVTSISKKVPMLKKIKEALNKLSNTASLYGGDMDSECIGKHFVDTFWEMKPLGELTIEDLISYCKENNINTIIPTRDGELPLFSSFKNELEENKISVVVPDHKTVVTCIDKLKFYEDNKDSGFPIIPTYKKASDLKTKHIVIKERYGTGSKQISLGAFDVEKFFDMEEPIYQDFVEGEEISIDLYVTKKKKVKGVILRKRDLVIDGESQITTTFEDEKLKKLCSDLALHLGIYGHAVIQVFIDKDKNYHIIECNSRFGGASTLSVFCGLESFKWAILEANGFEVESLVFNKIKSPIKQIRIKKDELRFE